MFTLPTTLTRATPPTLVGPDFGADDAYRGAGRKAKSAH
jgi:hypothetical protein